MASCAKTQTQHEMLLLADIRLHLESNTPPSTSQALPVKEINTLFYQVTKGTAGQRQLKTVAEKRQAAASILTKPSPRPLQSPENPVVGRCGKLL